MKLILSVFILSFSLSAFSLSQASSTVGQFAGPGQSYQATSDGNIPCPCNGDASKIQAKNQYASLAPAGDSHNQAPAQGTGGVDTTPDSDR